MDGLTWVLALAGVLVVGVVVLKFAKREKPEEPFYHFRCPECRCRLKYRKGQIGHKGQCARCQSALTFPPISWSLEGRKQGGTTAGAASE
jgi:hypothetical protein